MRLVKTTLFDRKHTANITYFAYKTVHESAFNPLTKTIRRIQSQGNSLILIEVRENQITKTKRYR